jgi:hypothetical protein
VKRIYIAFHPIAHVAIQAAYYSPPSPLAYLFHGPASAPSQNVHSRPFLLSGSRPHSRSKVGPDPTTAIPSHYGGVAAAHSMAICPLSPFTSLAHLISQFTASVEVQGQPQSHCMAPTCKRPGARNEEICVHEGSLTISGDRCPPAIDNVQAEITTNGTTILLAPKDSMSSELPPEGREDPKPEPATAESPRSAHHVSSASALATASTPPPSALEGNEGAPCLCHPITVMLLTGNATTQSPR